MASISAKARVIVLHGQEIFLQHEYTRQVREALAGEHERVDTIRYDGTSARLADVLDECRSFGLMSGHKLVIVDQAEELVKDDARPIMERYASDPSDSATLVLRAGARWPTGTKLDAQIEKIGGVIKCVAPSSSEAAAWTTVRARKRHALEIAPNVARAIVERVGAELGRLDMEIAKLAVAVAPAASVSLDHVREHVGLTREEEGWSIKHALTTRSVASALAELRVILSNAPRDAEVLVTFACIDLARQLHAGAHLARAGVNPFAMAGRLKLWGSDKDAVLAAASRVSPDAAASLFRAAIDADQRVKSGLGDVRRALEVLAIRIASQVRSASDKR